MRTRTRNPLPDRSGGYDPPGRRIQLPGDDAGRGASAIPRREMGRHAGTPYRQSQDPRGGGHASLCGSLAMISRYQIFLLVSATFLASLDASIIGPALNTFRIEWEVAERDLSWVFSAYFFFYLVGAPLMARVSDLRGRKKVLIASMGIFTAGSLLIAMSGSYAPLLVGRAMQGIGVAGIMPVILAYIGDRLPREK